MVLPPRIKIPKTKVLPWDQTPRQKHLSVPVEDVQLANHTKRLRNRNLEAFSGGRKPLTFRSHGRHGQHRKPQLSEMEHAFLLDGDRSTISAKGYSNPAHLPALGMGNWISNFRLLILCFLYLSVLFCMIKICPSKTAHFLSTTPIFQ